MTCRVVAPGPYGYSHIQTLTVSIQVVSRLTSRLSSPAASLPIPPGTLRRLEPAEWTALLEVAADDLDLQMLEDKVSGREESPLAASTAGLVLLRAHRLDLLHGSWLRNLSDWFPEYPDAPVLWAEQTRLASMPADQSLETRAEHLQRLTERGLPRLSEVLPTAWRQLAELPEEGLDPPWRPPLLEKILGASESPGT
jgi:hypothetical protein